MWRIAGSEITRCGVICLETVGKSWKKLEKVGKGWKRLEEIGKNRKKSEARTRESVANNQALSQLYQKCQYP